MAALAVLLDPEAYGPPAPWSTPIAVLRGYDRLAAALAGLGTDTAVVEGSLAEAPPGLLLLDGGGDPAWALARCPSALRPSVWERVMLLGVPKREAGVVVERHRLAGALTSEGLSAWLTGAGAGELIGRRDVLASLGLAALDEPGAIDYAGVRAGADGLPRLTVTYLHRYLAVARPLSFSHLGGSGMGARLYDGLIVRLAEIELLLSRGLPDDTAVTLERERIEIARELSRRQRVRAAAEG